MTRRVVGVWICGIVLVAGGLAGCGRSSATQPSSDLTTGTWSGAIPGMAAGTGALRLVLTQSGAGVAGTFTIGFPDASQNQSGGAGGTVLANTLTLSLTPSVPVVCSPSVTLSGTIAATLTVATDHLTGSYTTFTCGGTLGGALDLQRQ